MESKLDINELLKPVPSKKPIGKKVWSIDLTEVWIPFFTSTNVEGKTEIAPDVLGLPLRLQYDKSGAVRFSQSGKPVIRVAKELSDNVNMVKSNLEQSLIKHANTVKMDMPKEFKTAQELSYKMGLPIAEHDRAELTKAVLAIEAKIAKDKIANDVIGQAESLIKETVAVS
jgi:hypothetical protein